MGHLLTPQGIKPDPEKIEAIQKFPTPEDKSAVQRLLGMLNYLSKFLPNISHITEPLRRLTDRDSEWKWLPEHEIALEKIRNC